VVSEAICASAGLTVARKGLTAATGLRGPARASSREYESVVAEIDPKWDGFTEDDGEVVGMLARVCVTNHGAELVKSLTVKMHHRETGGTYSSKFLAALPATDLRSSPWRGSWA
jgi:hypothetical protein